MHNTVVRYSRGEDHHWTRSFVALIIKFVLISLQLTAFAYNIDTRYPKLYPEGASNWQNYAKTDFSRGYFGYSVLLYHNARENTTWLFIGAPRANYTLPSRNRLLRLNEPGVVYRCACNRSPNQCVEIEPAVIEDEDIHLRQILLYGRLRRKQSWFGSAMSVDRNRGFLTICAPRTIISIMDRRSYLDTIHGLCYSDRVSSTMFDAEMSAIQHYDFSKHLWYDPMHGFSVAFASTQGGAVSRIIGRPNDETIGTVSMVRLWGRNFLEIYRTVVDVSTNSTLLSHFGYALTSGYYFDRTRFLYASSDPGWDYVGQVSIIDPDGKPSVITNLRGSDIGEYFGASLASGDLNGDGFHDLVVGAPHWGNDNGRVHLYLGSPNREFEAAGILEGASEDALFGYAVTSGDLDGDGCSEIVVGAPWEESGAIYIYNGDASLNDKVEPVMSQRITVESLWITAPYNRNMQTFGFSISEPIDIDSNGYADIAVGAYKSGHVVLLRSRPVVRTNLTIYTIPNILQRNVSEFVINVCVEYHHYDAPNTEKAFKISLSIDAKYKRTNETLLELLSENSPSDTCVNSTIRLLDNIQDFIEPIAIYAVHNFTHDSTPFIFCETCPVEKGGKSSRAHALLPFDIGCGEDGICNSSISAIVKFLGTSDNDSWVIGSNDISLEAHLTNHAEPAYLTMIAFTLPHGIILRSILPSCEEYTEEDKLVVTCNVRNPLGTGEQAVVKLDLDMRYLTDGSLHGQILKFSAEIRMRSVNYGTRTIESPLTLQSEASLFINGKATETSYYLPDLSKEQLNVSFRHTYQILKFGATSIKKAQLLVHVPTTVEDTGSLVFLHKPMLYISGVYHECSSDGIDLVDVPQNSHRAEVKASDSGVYAINSTDEILEDTAHKSRKRDIKSYATVAALILRALHNAKDPNGNLTADVVYLNCSSHGVNCSTVYCDLSALKTQQDVGELTMKLILNATKLKGVFGRSDETKIVKFNTQAHVQILQPANRISSAESTRNRMNLTTEFHSTAKIEKLQLWVVFLSASFGLILLSIVIIILSTVGFFKRKKKEELCALKTNEITEDTNRVEITSTREQMSPTYDE